KPAYVGFAQKINAIAPAHHCRPGLRDVGKRAGIGVIEHQVEVIKSRSQCRQKQLHPFRAEILVLPSFARADTPIKKPGGIDFTGEQLDRYESSEHQYKDLDFPFKDFGEQNHNDFVCPLELSLKQVLWLCAPPHTAAILAILK